MIRKLGETLVDSGKITEGQLHRALTAQLVFGGHLGTSLLELGYLDEESLGETLSGMFSVPYADFEMLSKVPYSVVRSLPARLVEKHKVVPLRMEGKVLHLAMIDPKNLLALDEISFVTGYRIVPWVSPEVRVVQVLEKYYNMPRSQRFTTLARELSRLRSRRDTLRPLQSEEVLLDAEARPVRMEGRTEAGPEMRTEVRPGGRLAAAAGGGGGASTPGSASLGEAPADHWEKYGYGRSWREVADAIEGRPSADDLRSEEIDTRPQPAARPPVVRREAYELAPMSSLAEVSRKLASAESVDEIVSLTLGYVGARLKHSVFFVVRGDRAIGWAGQGDGITESMVRSLALPHTDETSIFSLVGVGQSHYLGAAPPAQAVANLYGRLGIKTPRTALVVPVVVKGRVTAYLYGDGGDQEILALDLPAVLTLCARAAFALQIIILRNKILAT